MVDINSGRLVAQRKADISSYNNSAWFIATVFDSIQTDS